MPDRGVERMPDLKVTDQIPQNFDSGPCQSLVNLLSSFAVGLFIKVNLQDHMGQLKEFHGWKIK